MSEKDNFQGFTNNLVDDNEKKYGNAKNTGTIP